MKEAPDIFAFDDRDNDQPYPIDSKLRCPDGGAHVWIYADVFLTSRCYCAYCGADAESLD